MAIVKLAAIFNVWFDSIEHLPHSLALIAPHVDIVIIMDQSISNRGQNLRREEIKEYDYYLNQAFGVCAHKIVSKFYTPNFGKSARTNESQKRLSGLEEAKKKGATHYFHIDCDEYWPEFSKAKYLYVDSEKDGMACRMFTYFKKPTLRLEEPEGYYVPFIHKIKQSRGRNYPVWADPTRTDPSNDIFISEEPLMHHMSYVRKDILRKLKNSSANHDKPEENEYIMDYKRDLKHGDYIHCFKQRLIEVPDQFNLTRIFR